MTPRRRSLLVRLRPRRRRIATDHEGEYTPYDGRRIAQTMKRVCELPGKRKQRVSRIGHRQACRNRIHCDYQKQRTPETNSRSQEKPAEKSSANARAPQKKRAARVPNQAAGSRHLTLKRRNASDKGQASKKRRLTGRLFFVHGSSVTPYPPISPHGGRHIRGSARRDRRLVPERRRLPSAAPRVAHHPGLALSRAAARRSSPTTTSRSSPGCCCAATAAAAAPPYRFATRSSRRSPPRSASAPCSRTTPPPGSR